MKRAAQPRSGGNPDRGVDGLQGFPEAITAVFPLTSVQTCIVHLSRYFLSFGGWKERQALARD
jgi:putative transposase